MPDAHDFLRTLTVVLGVAAGTTVLFQWLRQPVVFGYLIAGLILGPHVPIPLVADVETVNTLSELGVILLMFSLGLEFSVRRLFQGGWTTIIVAVLQSSFMLWIGYTTGRLFGWSVLESVFAGAAIAISSTTIILKAFAEQKARGRFTELVFGVLIIEDLLAILLIALLTPAATGQGLAASAIGMTIVRLVGFLVALQIVGMLVVPPFVRFVVRLERPETTLVACIGIGFGTALLAQRIGYSVALGAFLAGSLVAESGESKRIERLIEPVRDMFAAIFFVSVGMLIQPELVAQHWIAVLVFTALVIAGKIGAVSVSAFLAGTGVRTAVQSGMSLAQIGEFSFIIAGIGLASGATSPALYPIMVAVSALTTLTTPWLIRAAKPVAGAIDRSLPRALQTFVALYASWMERVRLGPENSENKAHFRRALRALAIDACVIAALCVGVSVAGVPLGRRIAQQLGVSTSVARAIAVGGAVVLAAPFLIGIVRTGRSLGQSLSRRAFPDPKSPNFDSAAAPRRAMVVTIQLATFLVVGAPIVAVTQPFIPPFAGVALLIACLLGFGLLFWRSAAELQGHVRAAAAGIVETIGRHSRGGAGAGEGERALKRAYELLPGLGDPFPVRIEASSPAVGMCLADIGLRGKTGATIVAISRGADVVLVPDGHEVLRADDVVALAGTRDAIDAAKALLVSGEEAS